jgi:hypothetical protein
VQLRHVEVKLGREVLPGLVDGPQHGRAALPRGDDEEGP